MTTFDHLGEDLTRISAELQAAKAAVTLQGAAIAKIAGETAALQAAITALKVQLTDPPGTPIPEDILARLTEIEATAVAVGASIFESNNQLQALDALVQDRV